MATSFLEWSRMRRTGSREIDSDAEGTSQPAMLVVDTSE
jgi:hypothetical protein